MQILTYEQYYRLHGVRFLSQLHGTRLSDLTELNFPRNSVLLYPGEFLDDYVPLNTTDVYFSNITKRVNVYYYGHLTVAKGKITSLNKNLTQTIVKFHNKHPLFKYTPTLEALSKTDPNNLAVISLSLLDENTRYAPNLANAYYKAVNNIATILDAVTASNFDKQYFLPIIIPATLPDVTLLNNYSRVMNPKIGLYFNNIETVTLLEIWKLFSDKPEESMLSSISKSIADKLNLLMIHGNKYYVINFGKLISFSSASEYRMKSSIAPILLRKLLLKSLITMTLTDVVTEQVADVEDDNGVIDEAKVDEFLESVSNSKSLTAATDTGISNIAEDIEEEVDPEKLLEVDPPLIVSTTPLETYKKLIEDNAESDNLTSKEYRDRLKSVETLKSLKDPVTKEPLLSSAVVTPEMMAIDPAKTTIPDNAVVLDKSMLKSTLLAYDKEYINNVMHRHTKAMVLNLLNAGVVVEHYDIQRTDSILGSYDLHTVKLKPLNGVSKTINFKMPVLNERGEFKAAGNTYRMRKQRVDLPIVKIAPGKVSLSSYYGKVFVNRSELKTDDYTDYINREILVRGYSEDPIITSIVPGGQFNPAIKSPKIFSTISMRIGSFVAAGDQFYFDQELIDTLLPYPPIMGHKLCGLTKSGLPIYVGFDNIFYMKTKDKLSALGDIYDITGIDPFKAPDEVSTVGIFGEAIPLAIVLGYLIGFFPLLKLLNVKPKIIPAKQRYELGRYDLVIRFNDYKLIFDKRDRKSALILAGMNKFDTYLKTVNLEQIKLKDIYLNILESKDVTTRYLREIENLNALFVDPITKEVLTEMKEPTTFVGLLFRSNELLTTDDHPDPQDIRYGRIRGYERMTGAVYRELVDSYRNYNARQIKGKNGLEMSPFKVWSRITSDPSVMLVADINPIENLKQQEAVTLVGDGGRSKEGINMAAREYHDSDIGIISEAGVDSGDVGINTFLSSNPNLTNMYGMTRDISKEDGITSVLSTSGNIAIGTLNDNMRRAMFTGIQNSHTVGVKAYTQNYLRTGYDSIVSSRVSDTYAVNAAEDGKVVSVNDKGVIVKYKSGKEVGYELGTRIGSAEGSYYPHVIVPNVVAGQSFKAGDNLCYNDGFFEQDALDPTKVVLKNGMFYKVALLESPETNDDSSVISTNLAEKLVTDTVKQRSVVLDFKQAVHKVVKIGDQIEMESPLLLIEDELTNRAGLFDEESIDALKRLSDKSPKAKYKGEVLDIIVYYNGDIEFMSESLKKLTIESNTRLRNRAKSTNGPVYTGLVDTEYRVDGNPLQPDTLEVKIFIKVVNPMVSGDKVVFSNQLKSVVTVSDTPITTEDGDAVDAIYGARSVSARMVVSPFIIGTVTTLLREVAKQAVAIYKK